MIVHTLNAMECIEILVHRDLENGSSSLSVKMKWLLIIRMMTRIDLPARDNAVCKEE